MQLRSRRRTKINYDQCLAVFESNPKKGIETLIARGYLMEDPDCVARFLRCRGLPKGAVGGYLGEHSEFCQSVMRIYISELHFEGMPINEAVRSLLQHFRLPAEAQKIERIVEQFASCYFEGRPESSPIHTSDCAFVLTFSLIMLHTDAHSREIRPESKMTKEQFIRNNGGINGSEDLPREYLSTLYDLITAEEWVMEEDATRRLRADVAVEASTSLAVALGFSQSTIGRRRQEVFLRETQQWIEAFANEVDSGLKSEEQGPLLSRGMHVDDLVARFEVVISELLWSVLPTHAYVLETSTCDTEEVLGVLGLRHVTHIACHYRISELCGAVVAALTKTAGLHVQSVTKVHMGTKEIRATIAVLECIRKDFAGIGPHWFAVLYSASEVERLLAAARYYDKNPRNLYTVESDSSPESAVRTPLESTAAHCQGDALFLEKDAVDFRSFPLIKLSKASCRHFFLAFKKVAELHLARDPPHAWPLICLLEGSKTLSATQSEFFTSSLLPILDDLIRSVAVAEVSGFWAVEAWRDLVCSMLRNQSAPDVNDAFLCFNFLVNSSSVSFEHSCLSVKYFLAVIQTHWNVLQRHLPMVLRSLDASMSGFEKEVMRSPDYILARNYWANLLTATTFVIRHNEDGIAWAELVPLLGRIAAVSPWMAKKSEDVESLRCDTRCPLMAVATLTAIATSHVDPPRLTTDAILTSEDEQTLTGVRLLRWPRNPQLVHDVCSQLALVGLLEGVSVPIHSAALSSLSIVVQSNLGLITDDMWTELLSGSRGFCALLTRVVALADSAPARTPPRDCPLDPHVDSWEDALIRLGPLHLLETWLQAWTFFTCDEVKAGKGERSVEVLTLTAALVVPAALQGGYSHQVSDFILRRILETVRCVRSDSSGHSAPGCLFRLRII
ncbi:MAG: uncharacterized protein KVP18_004203 [Porospora cf. gigantea A]|uniref:uncharacterized protein n=1 Tax=Porospora cf. gigantea A TaxID=2853593 RepID=UPI0035599288|nr:MAG: hypothetical protein KVP18_004203 [Porospora cf. gigantea A]